MTDLQDPFWIRGGVLLVDFSRQIVVFAIDASYNTLIDFGGGREPEDGDIIETAQREAYEESIALINLDRNTIQGGLMLTSDKGTVLFLVPVSIHDPKALREEFHRRRQSETMNIGSYRYSPECLENSDIAFLSFEEFLSLCHRPILPTVIYPLIQELLCESLEDVTSFLSG